MQCWELDLKVWLHDSNGQPRAEFICTKGTLTLFHLPNGASGSDELEIQPLGESSDLGGYALSVDEIAQLHLDRQGGAEAIAAFSEGERLRNHSKSELSHEAIKKYLEAQEYWERQKDRRAQALTLRRIGQTYQSLDAYRESLAYYQLALQLAQRINDVRLQTDILNDVAFLHFAIGSNDEALSGAAEALKLSERDGYRRGEAEALYTIGEAHFGLGDLPGTLNYFKRAIAIWRELNDRQGQAKTLVAVGYSCLELSDLARATESYSQALSIARAAGDRRYEVVALRAQGNLQTKLGKGQQAFDSFLEALEILKTFDDRHLKAIVLGGVAYAYSTLGEREKALEYYNQALAIYEAVQDVWGIAEAEMTIGEIYYSLGENESALSHYLKALPAFRRIRMSRQEAKTLRDIGLVYETWGDDSKALDYYKKSLKLSRSGQDQRYEAYTLNYIGGVYERSADSQKAGRYYQQALSLNRIAEDPAGESFTLYNLAHLARDQGRLDEARTRIAAALEISETLRSNVASQDLRAAYVASAHRYFELSIDIFMRLAAEQPGAGFEILAFELSERARSRSLLESLKEARADIREGVDPILLEKQRTLEKTLDAKAERRMRLVSNKNKVEADNVAKEIAQISAEYDEVKTQIRRTSPRYSALTQPQPVSLRDVQQWLLDDNSLLLEYALGEQRSYLWAVTRTEILSFELPSRAIIENSARRFYKLLTADQPVAGETFPQRQARVVEANAHIDEEAASFSSLVLGPVMDKLERKRLLVVAEGALQYIPFQALTVPRQATGPEPQGQSGRARQRVPLIIDHEIVNEPSASTLALVMSDSAQRQPADKSIAVFANPVFEADDPRVNATGAISTETLAYQQTTQLKQAFRDVAPGDGLSIPPLPASREEAEAIVSMAPWHSAFKALGFDASRATVVATDLGRFRIVHFATHGFVDYEHPELSGLVLSLVDRRGHPQEGFLRLHDIYNLKLPVDLVVLSACNTGLGKDVKGEGLIGLTRGFMYAGASSVVASLWKVDDDATAELMRLFYGYMLRDGLSPAAALRQAQLTMSQQKRWQSPYFWAGFVIQGQYLQPERSSRFPIPGLALWGIAAAVLSAAGIYALKRRRKTAL